MKIAMHKKYNLSPDMQTFVDRCESFFDDSAINQGLEQQRRAYNAMTASFARERSNLLVVTDQLHSGVRTRCYQPKDNSYATTILYAHGGGWYLGGLDSHDSYCADIAQHCQVRLIAVDYRLAPEFAFPAALDDCFNVYQSLIHQGIAPLLMGDSAGANLMAALTLRCKEYKLVQSPAQILIYPALAPPLSLPSHHRLSDAPLVSSDSIKFCLENYIPHCYRTEQMESIFPLQAKSLESLPTAAIFAGQFDPLIDDAQDYSRRLQEHDVASECFVINGLVHGALQAIGRSKEADDLFQSIAEQVLRFKQL